MSDTAFYRDSRTVVVAMLTYRRPDCLVRVLAALVEQAAALSPAARILVVDNDPASSAQAEVLRWQAQGVEYVHEPRPGLAAARNRALDESAGATLLAFIDDDEMPSTHWLTQLVGRWDEWRCAAVTGPVVSSFPTTPDAWLLASGAFDRRRLTTGTVLRGAATNNLLLDLAAVRRWNLRFDERFGLTGGEDTMFTHHLVYHGGVIRWCDEAEVSELVPASRMTRRWVLSRHFRAGTSWGHVELALTVTPDSRLRRRLHLAARGIVRSAGGLVRLARGIVTRDVHDRARGLCIFASYAGMLAGTVGFSFEEYRRSAADGSSIRRHGFHLPGSPR